MTRKHTRLLTLATSTASFLMQFATLFVAVTFRSQISASPQVQEGDFEVFIVFSITAAVSTLLGLLIHSRNPRHTIGWLFIAIGFSFSWVVLSNVVFSAFGDRSFSGPLQVFLVMGSLLYLLPLILSLNLIPLLFPDGRLPSARWRPVLYISLTGIILATASQVYLDIVTELPNLASPGIKAVVAAIQEIAAIPVIIGILGGIASLVFRFTRSRGLERMQMKWLVYTATLSISLMFLLLLLLGENSNIVKLYSSSIPIFLAIGIGFAVLRFRLYDIDIIIRRTLQYALLTAVLAGIYYGGIVFLQSIVGNLSGDTESPLILVVSTLAIAALFNPLRIRIQELIDRRFYRAKYDAEKVLAGFAASARDEVDLEALAVAMLGAVEETLQPESVNLLLKPPKIRA